MNAKVKPRIYQEACLGALKNARASGKNKALVVMASGLGKTLTGIFDIKEYLANTPNGRVLVLCHSAAILAQTKETFKGIFGDEYSYGMYNGLEKAAHRTDFLFANLQSINRHSDEFAPDEFCYVIVDEAHHSPAETYCKAIQHFTPQFLLGMTATPERMDDADLSAIFGSTVFEYRLESAIKDGWLSDVEYHVKTDEIQKLEAYLDSEEKFSLAQLNREVFVPKRDEEIVRIIREEIAEKDDPTTVIFCQSITHAEKFAELMGDAVVIHSELEDGLIAERLEKFRSGDIKTVCAVDMLNEGIDVPRTDVIVFLRVTQSKIVFTQQLGRGLRRTEGKDKVLVLDFVSTADRLDMLFQFEREFKSSVGQYPNRKPGEKHDCFTLDIDAPVFRDREVDIIALIERARNHTVQYTKNELIVLLQQMAAMLGRTPYMSEINNNPQMPDSGTYRNHFGSYNKAVIAAGLMPNPWMNGGEALYSDEELLDLLRQKAENLDRTPTKREVDADLRMPSEGIYRYRFGSYARAIELAQLVPNIGRREEFSEEELIKMLRTKEKRLGRTPTRRDVDEDPKMPSGSCYISHFKSWNKALEMAGLPVNRARKRSKKVSE